MREYLEALLPMLSGESSSVDGQAVSSHGSVDVDAPAPQVVVAALGPKMLDREGASGPEDTAVIGSAAEVADRLAGVSESGVTTLAALEFGNPDELAATRDVLMSLL